MIWIKIEIAGLWHVEISPKKGHEIRGLEVGRKEVFQDLINDNENYEYLKLIMPVWPANRASNTVLWSNKHQSTNDVEIQIRCFTATCSEILKKGPGTREFQIRRLWKLSGIFRDVNTLRLTHGECWCSKHVWSPYSDVLGDDIFWLLKRESLAKDLNLIKIVWCQYYWKSGNLKVGKYRHPKN